MPRPHPAPSSVAKPRLRSVFALALALPAPLVACVDEVIDDLEDLGDSSTSTSGDTGDTGLDESGGESEGELAEPGDGDADPGACDPRAEDDDCDACMKTGCCAAVEACAADSECVCFMDCLETEGGFSTCTEACAIEFDNATIPQLFGCQQLVCDAACS